METESKQNTLLTPIAIIVAGVLIAGGLYFGISSSSGSAGALQQGGEQLTGDLEQMKPITANDHIRGNPDAKVVIVEYSDMECPFCKAFHSTLQQAVKAYDREVAWVYGHFPLDQLHSKARKEAVAAECAAEQGGPSSSLGTSNDVFWKYTDRFFELTPSNDRTNIETVLPQIAKEIGLDTAKFARCLTSKKYDAHIEDDVQN